MTVELKEEAVQSRPRSRTEISPEVYAELTENLKAALTDLAALRGGIPCFLSAPSTLAARVEKHLALIQGAIGSIQIVRTGPVTCAACQGAVEAGKEVILCSSCGTEIVEYLG